MSFIMISERARILQRRRRDSRSWFSEVVAQLAAIRFIENLKPNWLEKRDSRLQNHSHGAVDELEVLSESGTEA